MISKKTVLILGAGSNGLYKFPSGRKLRYEIIKNFVPDCSKMSNHLLINESMASTFVTEFKNSNIESIDKFLNLRQEYQQIGKVAIATEILKAESKSIFSDDLEWKDIHNCWYSFLYNKMLDEISEPDDASKFKKNDISFITFNYDRSLDHFLYDSFSHSIPPDNLKTTPTKELFPFDIIHVYGSADLCWQNPNDSLSYNKTFDYNANTAMSINTMADAISIIYDHRNKNKNILKAQTRIVNAERVLFLGFGYSRENIEVLDLPNKLKGKKVFGTALGMSEAKRKTILKNLYGNQAANPTPLKNGAMLKNISLFNMDCISLLDAYLN